MIPLKKKIDRGQRFYGSRMTSQEAILKSLNFWLKTAFLGVPRPVVKAPLKIISLTGLYSMVLGISCSRARGALTISHTN